MSHMFKRLWRSEFLGQAIRFGVVGVANTVVGLGIIYACLFLLRWSDPAANITGYTVGLIQSFALNRGWTFRSRVNIAPAFLRFLIVFGVSYSINLALVLGLRSAGIGPALAHAAGMPIYTILFFLLSRWLVFRSAAEPVVFAPAARPRGSAVFNLVATGSEHPTRKYRPGPARKTRRRRRGNGHPSKHR